MLNCSNTPRIVNGPSQEAFKKVRTAICPEYNKMSCLGQEVGLEDIHVVFQPYDGFCDSNL